MVSAGRVFALIDERNYEPLQENGQAEVKEGNIRFENVCFSYDGKHPILDDISFSVNKGETIALSLIHILVSAASQERLLASVFLEFALEICLLKYDLTIFKTIQTSE